MSSRRLVAHVNVLLIVALSAALALVVLLLLKFLAKTDVSC